MNTAIKNGMSKTHKGSEYGPEQLEFLRAVDRYREEKRRRFLNAVDFLEVVHKLGYRKSEK